MTMAPDRDRAPDPVLSSSLKTRALLADAVSAMRQFWEGFMNPPPGC